MCGFKYRLIDSWIDKFIDGQIDLWMERWTGHIQMVRQIDYRMMNTY